MSLESFKVPSIWNVAITCLRQDETTIYRTQMSGNQSFIELAKGDLMQVQNIWMLCKFFICFYRHLGGENDRERGTREGERDGGREGGEREKRRWIYRWKDIFHPTHNMNERKTRVTIYFRNIYMWRTVCIYPRHQMAIDRSWKNDYLGPYSAIFR